MNLFMNKNNGSQFELKSKINWKTTNTTPNDLMNVMCYILISLRSLPLLFHEIKLIYLYKYVHSHYQKE
jgi:hypothetical protein